MTSMLKGAELGVSNNAHPDFLEPQEVGLGDEHTVKGRTYKYVKFNTDADIGEGDAVEYADLSFDSESSPTDPHITEVVVSGATSGGGNAIDGATAGAALTSHSPSSDGEAKYGWIQTKGPIQNLTDTSNGVSAGDYCEPDSSNDGEWAASGTDDKHQAGVIAVTGASSETFDGILIAD